MPNGGSDCCGTCWFNRANRGLAGFLIAEGAAYCEIRDLDIPDPFYTYCANHPHRCPERDPIPIGPVFVDPKGEGREIWRQSPDTEEVRTHLLDLLARIEEPTTKEYPIGGYRDEVVVYQLGEFRESRAIPNLERIANFNPRASTGEPLRRTRKWLVEAAKEALTKIRGRPDASTTSTQREDLQMIASVLPLIIVLATIVLLGLTGNLFSSSLFVIVAQVAAVLLNVWARISFKKGTFRVTAAPSGTSVITRGPYRIIRHPMYSAALLFIWAGVAGHLSAFTVAVGIAVTILCIIRVNVEERLLRATYPDYLEYSKSTKAFIPYVF